MPWGQKLWELVGTPLIDKVTAGLVKAHEKWGKVNPAQLIHPLHSLGIEHLEQVLEPTTFRVIRVVDLERAFSGVKAGHKKALA